MKFTKFGKALLMIALSVGVVLGITSCVQSYTVGFLYVTGTVTAQSAGNGIISGFKIDHNTGNLIPINGLPVSSGGANPGRAVLPTGGRFIYVLNRGVNAEGGSVCTSADPCTKSNITQFAIGGNGILTSQQTFFTQGLNPVPHSGRRLRQVFVRSGSRFASHDFHRRAILLPPARQTPTRIAHYHLGRAWSPAETSRHFRLTRQRAV